MAAEPPEDAIANFVSFTSTTREQAIIFLKANNLDSQKAINAYFEDPTGSQLKTTSSMNENLTPQGYGHQEYASRIPATAPPSRPPSRVNTPGISEATRIENSPVTAAQGGETGAAAPPATGLTLAEREEQQLQQAVAMSLGQGIGQQEMGITNTAENQPEPHFGKATRDYYDEADWGMTLFNETAQEVVLDPEPEDRARVEGEPAFLRPTNDNLYLGGYLTILHEIPLAREALLLRNKVLFDYGQESQWWNGYSINLPKIVTIHDQASENNDWDDILYETQRLMAFLDSTKRSYGSADALASLNDIRSLSSDSEEIVARFLETWHAAAIKAAPDSPLATAFMSHAYKRTPFDDGDDETVSKELFVFEPIIEQEIDQTLYDVLDTAIWSDQPGEPLDDVWLEHVGDIVTMKLDSFNNAKSVNIKIPATFYPDRYLSSCRDLAHEFRSRRLVVQDEIRGLEKLMAHYTAPQSSVGGMGLPELLKKAAASIPVALTGGSMEYIEGDDLIELESASEKSDRISQELLRISQRIDLKLRDLEAQKEKAMETLRNHSKILTEAPEAPGEPPGCRYSLRGVCTEPHVTYVLKRAETGDPAGGQQQTPGDQWWRISYSIEDGKTRQHAKQRTQEHATATQPGDTFGYTATKVREIEVLRAAREEWRSVLLVYASDAAVNAPIDPAPTQLRSFVDKDNEVFAHECEQSITDCSTATDQHSIQPSNLEKQQQQQQMKPPPPPPRPAQQVNVFDYQVSNFGNDSDYEQEMQEKGGSKFLGSMAESKAGDFSRALDDDTEWHVEKEPEMSEHIEHAADKPDQA
ncbi:Uncharacterized protein PECH_008445 [Penicillium ucsense]|uniref:Ubiquitin interaction motif protein n=1 Tax=Penicillium ucsense TaxID=2839758 RepID=A0A8J8WLG2_9EURO|nr:Uncharacterized protein PECM_003691 [Penicillium ucsense]KAF7734132.1 Uncharacterized protein PECH_008445 [Penicillium ucsense]